MIKEIIKQIVKLNKKTCEVVHYIELGEVNHILLLSKMHCCQA